MVKPTLLLCFLIIIFMTACGETTTFSTPDLPDTESINHTAIIEAELMLKAEQTGKLIVFEKENFESAVGQNKSILFLVKNAYAIPHTFLMTCDACEIPATFDRNKTRILGGNYSLLTLTMNTAQSGYFINNIVITDANNNFYAKQGIGVLVTEE